MGGHNQKLIITRTDLAVATQVQLKIACTFSVNEYDYVRTRLHCQDYRVTGADCGSHQSATTNQIQLRIAHAHLYTITILYVQGCVAKVMVTGIRSLMWAVLTTVYSSAFVTDRTICFYVLLRNTTGLPSSMTTEPETLLQSTGSFA